MENLYPLFERNRVLKKELLWSLRDYTFVHVQAEYSSYGQGFLKGWDIKVQGGEVAVGPGLLKAGRFICLLTEETRIPFEASDCLQILKIRVRIDRRSPDYIAYLMEFYLDKPDKEMGMEVGGRKEEFEFELCRFHLRRGAKLRDTYTCFQDMITEYDTVNLIHGDWGGPEGKGVPPVLAMGFARAVLGQRHVSAEDRGLAYLCLAREGIIAREVLADYLERKVGTELGAAKGNEEYFDAMCQALDAIGRGEDGKEKGGGRRRRILIE